MVSCKGIFILDCCGLSKIQNAYIIKYNDGTVATGIKIEPDERIPLDRIELDVDNLVNLNSEDNLRNIITDHDFKKTSNANLLKNLMTLKKLHEEDFRKMKVDYTYEGHYGFE